MFHTSFLAERFCVESIGHEAASVLSSNPTLWELLRKEPEFLSEFEACGKRGGARSTPRIAKIVSNSPINRSFRVRWPSALAK